MVWNIYAVNLLNYCKQVHIEIMTINWDSRVFFFLLRHFHVMGSSDSQASLHISLSSCQHTVFCSVVNLPSEEFIHNDARVLFQKNSRCMWIIPDLCKIFFKVYENKIIEKSALILYLTFLSSVACIVVKLGLSVLIFKQRHLIWLLVLPVWSFLGSVFKF
jgi:hypothetical protein